MKVLYNPSSPLSSDLVSNWKKSLEEAGAVVELK